MKTDQQIIEDLKTARDEARAAYEADVNLWRNRHSELFMAADKANEYIRELETALRGLIEAEEATVEEFNAKEIDGLEVAMNHARAILAPASESQREAAESADEKPDGQAENAEPSHR